VDHFTNPQSVVPESVMPAYAFLADNRLSGEFIGDLMRTHRIVGVPYTDEMIENAAFDFVQQATDFGDGGVVERYPGAQQRDFDGNPAVTEMDAVIAYLQMLGTLVDFSTFSEEEAVMSR
jgi:cytochrome c oxidase cbb3-type subunit 2